jgi:hypothetical protein
VPESFGERGVVDGFFAVVEVARPARGQRDSGLFARLQQP